MNRPVRILNELPANKVGIQLFAEAVVENVMSGDTDPLDVRLRLDAVERIIKAIKDNGDFKTAVLDQADMWPEKSFEKDGVAFTKAELARYDYSEDQEWNDLKKNEGECVRLRKEREKVLFALSGPTEINGVTCNPPFKKSSTYVKITF